MFKYNYRVTKYNPILRNEKGVFDINFNEWTSFYDYDNPKFSRQNYYLTENAYIYIINKFIELNNSSTFKICAVENKRFKIPYRKVCNDVLMVEFISKQVLRQKFWCKIESDNMFIHFGYDYYMYIGSKSELNETVINFGGINIYLEKIKESPYF